MRCDEAEVELPDENNICMLDGALSPMIWNVAPWHQY